MNILLAATPEELFGTIAPPPGSGAFAGDPVAGASRLLTVGIQILITVAALFVLFYLLQGAFYWVTSNGEQEKLDAARSQMTNAVIGMIMIFVALAIFGVVTGDILGIVTKDATGGWSLKIPTINP